MSGGPTTDGIERVLANAATIARQHVPDRDGWCVGCLQVWGRLVSYPCTQAEWAAAVFAAPDLGGRSDHDPPGPAGPGQAP